MDPNDLAEEDGEYDRNAMLLGEPGGGCRTVSADWLEPKGRNVDGKSESGARL